MNLKDLIRQNITEIPYEGSEVDVEGIERTVINVMKGFVTFCHSFEYVVSKGYLYVESGKCKYFSREDIVIEYLKQM